MPALFLVWAWAFYGVPGSKIFSLLLSPLYLLISLLSFITALGMLNGKRWSWHLFLPLNALLVYHGAFTFAEYGAVGLREALFFLLFLGALLAALYRVKSEMRVPYLFPRVRWWERVTIEYCSVAVGVFRQAGTLAEGQIIDLSSGGCFIKTANEFIEGEELLLKFFLEEELFNVSGHVVWRALSTVTHPKGVGVKFGAIDRKTRRKLRRRIARLPVAERIQED